MPEQINAVVALAGTAGTSVAAFLHGGVLGGVALVVIVIASAIKVAGPELRAWVTMWWARNDAKNAKSTQPVTDAADRDEMPGAA